MASFLQSLFGGKKKEFVSSSQTVKIEKDPNDPEKEILRFGDGKDDYFPVKGDKEDKEALREILSKVIESPTQLKKIRDLPLENRPTLIRNHAKTDCGGYCNGAVISITPLSGTGYEAAGIFCHEFQHQYQYVKGDLDEWKCQGLTLSESILNDRMYEAAADTANYQYMYEMKDRNKDAAKAFDTVKRYSPGLKTYAAAMDAGKPELDCILAGMKGYASSYTKAKCYADHYHGYVKEEDAFSSERFTRNVQSFARKVESQATVFMNGKELNDVEAFKAHTIGMRKEDVDEIKEMKVHSALRMYDFNYVTPTVARAITRWTEKLKKNGEKTTENPENLWVKTAYGITDNRTRGGLAGLMFKAKTKLLSAKQKLKNFLNPSSKLGAMKQYHSFGKTDLYVASDKDGKVTGKIPFQAQRGIAEESKAKKEIGEKEVKKRTLKAQKMMAIVMESPYARKKIEELTAAGQEITLAFHDKAGKNGFAFKKERVILLDPSKSPEKLAKDFSNFFHPMANDLLKKIESEKSVENQTAPKTTERQAVPQTAEPKAEVKQAEPKTAEVKQTPKAAEPQQPEISGEVLLKMVDQLAFRRSNAQKSDDYYKPTPLETKLIDSLAKYTKDMVKSAGIDYRSVQAKPFKAKCLAEWAKSPQGKSGVTKLLQAHGNMKAFEKPREKQPLMQTLQAKTQQAQPQQPVKQATVAKAQDNQR